MSDPLPREIRCVLVPAGETRMLLPNASIAEVIPDAVPEPIANAPEWLLGRIAWRGWRVPLVAFSRLAGVGAGDAEQVVRVAVLKALGGDSRLPFVAYVTRGFPRLTTLNAELIIPTRDGKPLPEGVREHVLVRDDEAVIPDLEWIETAVLSVLEAANLANVDLPAAGMAANTDEDTSAEL